MKTSDRDLSLIFTTIFEEIILGKVDQQKISDLVSLFSKASDHPQGPLGAMGIQWKKQSNHKWRHISYLLHIASAPDAVTLFSAMATSLSKDKRLARNELMQVALSNPSWCEQAIHSKPEIFGSRSKATTFTDKFKPIGNFLNPSELRSGCAYTILARTFPEHGPQEALIATLDALAKYGVTRAKDSGDMTLMHVIATQNHSQKNIEAFASHFPELINKQNMQGETPMHFACKQGRHKSVRGLLAVGARTDLLSKMGDHVLDEAAKAKSQDCLGAILNHENFDEWTLRRAKSWAQGPEIKSLIDSKIAQNYMNSIVAAASNACSLSR